MKIYFQLLLLAFCGVLYGQPIAIPDANLRFKLLMAGTTANQFAFNAANQPMVVDTNSNGEIDQSEALLVIRLNLSYTPSSTIPDIAQDLTGLEYFTNLEKLVCGNNLLTSIHLPTLSHLKTLYCDGNNIHTLNLEGMTALETLTCSQNQLTNINFSGLPNLKYVGCPVNQLTTLDFSNNPVFERLTCSYNPGLTSINILNGTNQNPTYLNSNFCWKDGNPNLTTVCADATEVASVQAFLDSCGSSSQTVTVTSSCSMATETAVVDSFTITPNPSSGVFIVTLDKPLENAVITVCNVLGQQVMSLDCDRDDKNVIIDLTGYPIGVYLMVIESEKGIVKERIIKN